MVTIIGSKEFELDRAVNLKNAQKILCMHIVSFVGLSLMGLTGSGVSAYMWLHCLIVKFLCVSGESSYWWSWAYGARV